MKEKGRHSRESGNPEKVAKNKSAEIRRYFSMAGLAYAGMTNYDTIFLFLPIWHLPLGRRDWENDGG